MADVEVVRWAERLPIPWKNGAGTGRELASSPPGAGFADFDWRISVADVVSAAEFSQFLGVDRVIVLIEGTELVVTVEGVEHVLARFCPLKFDGGAATTCSLPFGPTRDLNVMTRRGSYRADIDVSQVTGTASWAFRDEREQLLIPLDADVAVSSEQFELVKLQRYDLLRLTGVHRVQCHGTGHLARIELEAIS